MNIHVQFQLPVYSNREWVRGTILMNIPCKCTLDFKDKVLYMYMAQV